MRFRFSQVGCSATLLAIAWLMLPPAARAASSTNSSDLEFFENRVRPILAEKCFRCHSRQAEKVKGGLLLDSRAALEKGGEGGLVLVPGQPDKSRLIEAIRYSNVDLQMPPKAKLSDREIADIVHWVESGAAWPQEPLPESSPVPKEFDWRKRHEQHWSWRAIQNPKLPTVNNLKWGREPVDAFILAGLERKQLQPAPPAEKRTLLRRLYFDLTGLPPTRQQMDAFLADPSDDAYSKTVDRLLASPHFGERWARHWLDLVRYAETLGHEFDYANPNAWRYRDYVIRAFNADIPYDQFVQEHIAGDLLEGRYSAEGENESIIGTAFYWLGQREHSPVDVRQHQAELIDNQIDVLSKTFLGLTVACARCHDHKFDAIPTQDYYSLYGILSSSRYTQRRVGQPDPFLRTKAELQRIKAQLREAAGKVWLEQSGAAAEWWTTWTKTNQPPAPGSAAQREGDHVYADFTASSAALAGWEFEEEAFDRQTAPVGEFLVGDGKKPVARVISRASMHSGVLSRRFQGVIRSPTFTITNRFIHVLAAGRESRINVPVDGFTMIRDPIYGALKQVLNSDEFRWITIDVSMWTNHHAYLEFSDVASPDPADDARRGGFAVDGYLAVRTVLFSDNPQTPSSEFWIGSLPDRRERTANSTQTQPSDAKAMIEDAVQAWVKFDPAKIDRWQIDVVDRLVSAQVLDAAASSECVRLAEEYAAVERSIPNPVRVPAMADGTGLDEKVFVRGNHRLAGEIAPRRFLQAIAGVGQRPIEKGSGRLDLARRMTDRSNPFLARVMVNRIWLHLFGRGIVPTPDDFGVLGQPPSHPELLDWLAHWYRSDAEWSTKKLIRLLVLSSAYRMDSAPRDMLAEQADPDNILLHRMAVKRLEGEAIRDSMLVAANRLDQAMFGPPVPIHLTEFMDGRGRPGTSGPLDGNGRRSIYIEVRRNFVSPMMRTFDQPVPFTTIGRRTVSNVPAQSLILMNDPFVRMAAKEWARQLLAVPDQAEKRIERIYETAFGRPGTRAEVQHMLQFVSRQKAAYEAISEDDGDDLGAWTDLCHVVFNLKEFIFLN